MSVRLSIEEIARYIRIRFVLQHRMYLQTIRRITQKYFELDFAFTSPEQIREIEKVFDVASMIVAERFVKNQKSIRLLTCEDFTEFLPITRPPMNEEMQCMSSSEQQKVFLQIMFVKTIYSLVSQHQKEDVCQTVREWVQAVLNGARAFGMEPHEFVKLPDAYDRILISVYPTPEAFLEKFAGNNEEGEMDRPSMIAKSAASDFLHEEARRLYGCEVVN